MQLVEAGLQQHGFLRLQVARLGQAEGEAVAVPVGGIGIVGERCGGEHARTPASGSRGSGAISAGWSGVPSQAAWTASGAGAIATRGAQPEARQARRQHRRLPRIAVEQQPRAVGEDEEIGQIFALRGQQRRPDGAARGGLGHVVGDQALQERDAVVAGDLQHGPVRQVRELAHGSREWAAGRRAASGRARTRGLCYAAGMDDVDTRSFFPALAGPGEGYAPRPASPRGPPPTPALPARGREKISEILFITANRIGDAVLTTGLLDHLLRTRPAARFTIACGPAAAGLFARMPRRDATLVFDKRRLSLHWLGLWARTAGTRWDLGDRPARLGARLLSAGAAAGGDARRPAAGAPAAPYRRRPRPRSAAAAGGLDRARGRGARRPPAAGRRPDRGPRPDRELGGKVWPAEHFVALFRALADGPLPGARAAIFAGPGDAERALAAPVLAALPGAIDLAGRLALPEAAACLARCTLFVGNDSGLMHLAAAAGAPTLGLFGPSMASQYAPAGRRTAFAVAPGPEGAAPIAALPVEAALAAALPLLDAARATEALLGAA